MFVEVIAVGFIAGQEIAIAVEGWFRKFSSSKAEWKIIELQLNLILMLLFILFLNLRILCMARLSSILVFTQSTLCRNFKLTKIGMSWISFVIFGFRQAQNSSNSQSCKCIEWITKIIRFNSTYLP